MILEKIRYTAAEVLAAAVYEMFPGVKLLEGSVSPSGFYYDFHFPHPIHPELHTQIEERMRQIIREKREIQAIEMVAMSAKGFLKSKGHANKASLVDGPGLFSLVQIGGFADLASGSYLENTEELEHFKLFPPTSLGAREMRILGTAFATKNELKEFVKRWNTYPKKRHERSGEIKHFWKFFEEGVVWLPEGIKELDKLSSIFKENLLPSATEIISPVGAKMHKKLLSELGVEAVCEMFSESTSQTRVEDVGLLDCPNKKTLQVTTFLKNAISSLQSIEKTLNILGCDFLPKLSCSKRGGGVLEKALKELGWSYEISEEIKTLPQLDFLVADGLGRKWSAVCASAGEHLSVQVVIERNLALLLYRV